MDLIADNSVPDEDIDMIRMRYEQLTTASYSEYMMTSGRDENNKLMYDAESEAYNYNPAEYFTDAAD